MRGRLKLFAANRLKIFLLIFILIFSIFLSFNVVSAQDNTTKIIFDETAPFQGKFYTIHNMGFYGSSSFAASLEENGYSVSALKNEPITPEKLKGYDILVIMAQYRDYSDEEINAIKEFVKNGGGLFLLGSAWSESDGPQNYAFNEIARSFGVDFAYAELLTNDENYLFTPNIFEINNLKPHPVTANVPKFYFDMGTYIKNPGSSNIIAYTDSNTFGDTGVATTPEGDTIPNYKKDSNENSGPFPVVSEMQYGEGKIVFSGSAEFFTNSLFYRSNAWKLGINTMSWLSNKPVPANYMLAGSTSFNLIGFQILEMILFSAIVFFGLFMIRREKRSRISGAIKTLKNWKFNTLIVLNAFFTVLAVLLFIPINFYLYDVTIYSIYDPNLGYTLIITGVLFLFFMGVILFNLIARQRLLIKYSYYNIVIILLFAGLTVILGDLYGFPIMEIFTFGTLVLLIPFIINLWIHRGYGQDLIIEGKEFDRLKKLTTKSLPFELQPFYTDAAYIGEGGFGRVFKATNNEGELVALKIPKSFDKKAERSFITEVSNWSHLDHPHIVKLKEYKILPIPFIETEYCEEGLEKGMKSLDEAVSIVYDIAKGLEYAHNNNIIHGDVKISNILIKNGVYKISDWGLSKLKLDESVTLSGATPSYAAPEQISIEFGKADERTDIYQLGNVFYELLTGRLPFEGDLSQIYSSILTTSPVSPAEINSNAKPVNEIILNCLNKNKDDRYSSMGELIRELEKYRPADKTVKFKDK